MAAKPSSNAILWLTIAVAPGALALESGLRVLLFPPEFEEVRELLEPLLTPIAWLFGAAAGVASLLGLGLQRRMAEKRMARVPDEYEARHREVVGVFLLSASVPQIPAIFSTFAYMFGASLWPVLVGIALCSVGVISQAMRVRSLAEVKSR